MYVIIDPKGNVVKLFEVDSSNELKDIVNSYPSTYKVYALIELTHILNQ